MKKIESATKIGEKKWELPFALELQYCDVDGTFVDADGVDIAEDIIEEIEDLCKDDLQSLILIKESLEDIVYQANADADFVADDDAEDLIAISLIQDDGAIVMQFKLVFDINYVIDNINSPKK